MGVETIGIVDTNADPFIIDHPIPANDDAVGSIKLIVSHILDAWLEGVKAQKPPKVESAAKEEKVEVKAEEKPKTETPLHQDSAEQGKKKLKILSQN